MKSLLASSLFLIVFAIRATACTCAGPAPPCQAYWEASAVFVGTVTFRSDTKIKEYGSEFTQRLIRFHVDQPIRGLEAGDIEVRTGLGDSDCGYGFRLGGQYLVYAYRDKDKMLETSICTRTRPFSQAAADLEYARGLSKAAPGGTISGEVILQRPGNTYEEMFTPVENARILFEGSNKHFETKTNRAGKYTISGLPPGKYKVRIDPPDGLSIYNPEQEVEVHDRGCVQAYFHVEPDTRITGKVLDPQGIPATEVLMELVPVTRQENVYPSDARTDKTGRYELKLLKPGRYHLGVRIAGQAGATYVPYPQTYYPGVRDRSQATIITITEGQRIELDELVLPPRFIERTLSGIVVDSDGKPVAGAVVWLKERQYDDSDMPYQRQTDSEGRFSYPVYEGIKYELMAYLEPTGSEKRPEAAPLTVVITSNPEPIKLVLIKTK